MNNLIKNFLENNIDVEYIDENFNYNFNRESTVEEFYIEFKKFLSICNNFFYYRNRLVFIINNYEICLKLEDIEQILELYRYAKEKNAEIEKMLLAEFIYTYHKTINTNEYKKNCNKNINPNDLFYKALRNKLLSGDFPDEFQNESYEFYVRMTNHAIENDIHIGGEIIHRMFNNLANKEYLSNQLINIFVANKINLCSIIEYDKEINIHVDTYLEYVYQSLDEFGGYNYAKEIIAKLDHCNSLDDLNKNNIINKYVDIFNKLGNKLKDKMYNFNNGLSEMDNLKKELNYIVNQVKLDKKQKNKIKECLNSLMGLKRYLISDEEYVRKDMKEMEYSQEVKHEEIEKIRKELLENNFKLYALSKMDFHKQMETALNLYSQFAIASIGTRMKIDCERQMYFVNIEENTRAGNKFKVYFDNLGKGYTLKNKDKLMNKLDRDYYEELLKNLSNTFMMQQSIIVSLFTEEEWDGIFKNLGQGLGYDFENKYAILVSNILAIEANIIELMEKHNIEEINTGFDNLNTLFDLYREDKDCINGLMYINYILYEKSGLNIRNNALHGNLINANITIHLIVTFSALIYTSWLLNGTK